MRWGQRGGGILNADNSSLQKRTTILNNKQDRQRTSLKGKKKNKTQNGRLDKREQIRQYKRNKWKNRPRYQRKTNRKEKQ